MYQRARRKTYELLAPELGGDLGYYLDWGIMLLIVANVIVVMLQTVDALATRYTMLFHWFELFSVAVFSIEYVGRIWTCVDDPDYKGPVSGRVRFAMKPLLVVDLLAITPFYLARLGFGFDLRFLRALRLVRFLRLLKLARYSQSMRAFGRVLENKREELVLAFSANGLLLILASSMMYYVEHAAQPEKFSSIPVTLWWGVATLTTVGYGDVYPITPLGKLLGAVVAVLGIGLFGLPASILASGFIEEATTTRTCPHCGERLDE